MVRGLCTWNQWHFKNRACMHSVINLSTNTTAAVNNHVLVIRYLCGKGPPVCGYLPVYLSCLAPFGELAVCSRWFRECQSISCQCRALRLQPVCPFLRKLDWIPAVKDVLWLCLLFQTDRAINQLSELRRKQTHLMCKYTFSTIEGTIAQLSLKRNYTDILCLRRVFFTLSNIKHSISIHFLAEAAKTQCIKNINILCPCLDFVLLSSSSVNREDFLNLNTPVLRVEVWKQLLRGSGSFPLVRYN